MPSEDVAMTRMLARLLSFGTGTWRFLRLGAVYRVVGAVLVMSTLVLPAEVVGDEPASPTKTVPAPDALQTSLFRGMTSLRSGAFSGSWTERFETSEEGQAYEFAGTIRGLFDDSIRSYALQRTKWDSNPRTRTFEAADYGILRTPQTISRYGQISGETTTRSVNDEHGVPMLYPGGEYFDPRLVGYSWWGNLSRGDVLKLEGPQNIRYRAPTGTEQEEAGRTRYEWEGPNLQTRLWVEQVPADDAGATALPVKLSRRMRYPDVDNNAWSDPLEVHEVSWMHVDGVHLPQRLHLEEKREVRLSSRVPKTPEERRFSLRKVTVDLKWERVNAEIDRGEFTRIWFQAK